MFENPPLYPPLHPCLHPSFLSELTPQLQPPFALPLALPLVPRSTYGGRTYGGSICDGGRSVETVALPDKLYFVATADQTEGIWQTDGTVAGTQRLTHGPGDVVRLAATNNDLYYVLQYGISQQSDLWKLDSSGTSSLVKSFSIVPETGFIDQLVGTNDTLFFTVASRVDRELWKTDGTAAGTQRILTIGGATAPSEMVNVNGTLYFTNTTAETGTELWKSDGTIEGTSLVKDIALGAGDLAANSSYPSNLTNVNGTLYFTATDGISGNALWKSDGTEVGTVLVPDYFSQFTMHKLDIPETYWLW